MALPSGAGKRTTPTATAIAKLSPTMTNGPTTATSSSRHDGHPNPTSAHTARRSPRRTVASTVTATATTGTAMLISGAMPACGSASAIASAST